MVTKASAKAFAHGLAEAGARVAVAGRRAEANQAAVEEARAAGHELLSLTADITRDDQRYELLVSPPGPRIL